MTIYIVFGIILCLLFIGFTSGVLLFALHGIHGDLFIASLILLSSFGLYVFGSVLAVVLLMSNLMNLSKLATPGIVGNNSFSSTPSPNSRSDTDTPPPTSPSHIELNRQQTKLSVLSARYLGLFVIANVSSVLLMVVIMNIYEPSGMRIMPMVMDTTINLICIYLQFAASKSHYYRLCTCCDKCFRRITMRRTKEMVFQHSMRISDISNTMSTVMEIQATSSTKK